jgi:hypothetical protein
MIQKNSAATREQQELTTRIERFYQLLNDQRWKECFELVDPKLRDTGKVAIGTYSNSLASFFTEHGPLVLQSFDRVRIYDGASNTHDNRDFAYGLVALEDREHHPLKTRERWVKASDGQWYTRMAGMV